MCLILALAFLAPAPVSSKFATPSMVLRDVFRVVEQRKVAWVAASGEGKA